MIGNPRSFVDRAVILCPDENLGFDHIRAMCDGTECASMVSSQKAKSADKSSALGVTAEPSALGWDDISWLGRIIIAIRPGLTEDIDTCIVCVVRL
jgi:hypothetical protein